MIKLQDLYKSFGSISILKAACLEIEEGDSIAIIGPSGIGKSTLLRLITGLDFIDSGSLSVLGYDYSVLTAKEWGIVRSKIGFLFQSAALFDSVSVFDNVAFILREGPFSFSEADIYEKVVKQLDLVGMLPYKDAFPSDLSGGQKKRVGLARAVVHRPLLMLYDEPTTGLDPLLSRQIEDLMVSLNQDHRMTTIVVTHQLTTMFRTVDKVYFLKDGLFIGPESPKNLKESSFQDINQFIEYGLT